MRIGFNARVGHGSTVGGTFGRYINARIALLAGAEVLATGQLVISGAASLEAGVEFDTGDLQFFNGRAILEGGAEVEAFGQIIISGIGLLEAGAEAVAAGQIVISGAALARAGVEVEAVSQIIISGAAVLEAGGEIGARFTEHKLLLEDVRFYLDTARGLVPIVGSAPAFSRSTAADSEDPNGREITALPNTPQYIWRDLDGFRRQLVRLQEAHNTEDGLQAVDRLYYPDAPAPGRDAFYLRLIADWDPETDAGHLIWLSDLTNAAGRLRIRHSGTTFYAEIHNGTASAEVSAIADHANGDRVELLVVGDEDADTLELIIAIEGAVVASASVALPAGGLPVEWSARYVVLNGFDQQPTASAAYAEFKILSLDGFARPGDSRLIDAREFRLSPAGEVI